MFVTVKGAVVVAIPAIVSLLGIFWLQRKRLKRRSSSNGSKQVSAPLDTSNSGLDLERVDRCSDSFDSGKPSDLDSRISQSTENRTPSSYAGSNDTPTMMSSAEFCDCTNCHALDENELVQRLTKSFDCILTFDSCSPATGSKNNDLLRDDDYMRTVASSDNFQRNGCHFGESDAVSTAETLSNNDRRISYSSFVGFPQLDSELRIMPCPDSLVSDVGVCEYLKETCSEQDADERTDSRPREPIRTQGDAVSVQSVVMHEESFVDKENEKGFQIEKSDISVLEENLQGLASYSSEQEPISMQSDAIDRSSTAIQNNSSADQVYQGRTEESQDGNIGTSVLEESLQSVVSDAIEVEDCADWQAEAFFPRGFTFVREFALPSHLCGRLIGKNGRNVKEISRNSRTDILVQAHPSVLDQQIVFIRGMCAEDVEKAFAMISNMFPEEVFEWPEYLYTPTFQQGNWNIDNAMVSVVSIVTANHVFLQLPEQSEEVAYLSQAMSYHYTCNRGSLLDKPVCEGTMCAALLGASRWFRGLVVESHPEQDSCILKFVDVGGYAMTSTNHLRKLREDFQLLPFQATECYLSDVLPPNGEEVFRYGTVMFLESLVKGFPVMCQVKGFASDGTPCITLCAFHSNLMVNVNQQLIAHGYARSS